MTAVFSRCGRYRYRLERVIGPGVKAAFIGVNPSTADATLNDSTIRKLIGFAPHLGVGHWLVGNVFACRATNIRDLRDCADPVGPRNRHHLRAILAEAEMVVLGWGTLGKLPPGLRDAHKAMLRLAEATPLWCWGVTLDGQPRHPLMLGYGVGLVEYRRPVIVGH